MSKISLIQTYRESDSLVDWLQRLVGITAEVENWREIGGTNNPAFENSWVNVGGVHNAAAFYKDPYDRVWLKGSIKTGTTPSVAFTLPVKYRPLSTVTYSSVDGTGTPSATISIASNGEISILAGTNTFISLDGISFRV